MNSLTSAAFCPRSKQPELKHSAVRVQKASLPWRMLGAAWLPADQALRVREQLAALMPAFAYAACVPFGHHRSGVLWRAAALEPPPAELLVQIETALGLGPDSGALRYDDKRRAQRRAARLLPVGGDTRLQAFLLCGDTDAEAWIRPLLQDELPAQAYGRLLLLPGARPPVATAERGRQVCTCFNVNESAITAGLRVADGSPDQRLAAVQASLRCGTNCGSCLPELRRLAQAAARPQALAAPA